MTALKQSEFYKASTNDSSDNPQAKSIASGSKLEADSVFLLPGSLNQPETTYLSSYYSDSYEFPWNPDILARGNNYRVYDEMRDDDQVKSAISFKKDIVVNAGWRIVCDKPEISDFITQSLMERLDEGETGKTFDDVLRDMLSAYEYGFSIAEPVYTLRSDNRYEYKSIKVRPPHSFRFKLDRFGNILEIIQATDQNELSLDPQKFLHHVYQQEFGNPYGKSDLKAAHPAWVAKKFFMRFFAVYVERFASPTVVGKYKPTADANEAQRFHNMIKTIQNATTLAIPEDFMVEFIQAQRDASDAYVKGLDMFNMWISRAILVPDLLGISGSKTAGGSYSLGETQFKMFLGTIEKDRKSLSRKITLKLIRPLVRANFGDYPVDFEFLPVTEKDELEYSKVWSEFIRARIVTPNEDEINHFRRSVKFPEGPVTIETPEPVDDEETPEKWKDKDKKDEKAEEDDKEKKEFSVSTFREKNRYETLINFTDIRKALDTSEDQITPRLRSAGKVIFKDFVDQVRSTGLIRRFEPEKINKLQPRFLRDMNLLFKDHFTGLFKKSYEQARKELFPNSTRRFAEAELLPEEFIDIVQAEAFKMVGDYSTRITDKGRNVLVNGIKAGLPENQIVSAMLEEMESASEKWLSTVIRTKTTEMFNEARKSYWENDPIAKEIVEAFEFSAIMDERTSDVCQELDGQVFEKGGFIDRVTPPLHFNCRSLLVPITKYQDYEVSSEPSIEVLKELGGNLIV